MSSIGSIGGSIGGEIDDGVFGGIGGGIRRSQSRRGSFRSRSDSSRHSTVVPYLKTGGFVRNARAENMREGAALVKGTIGSSSAVTPEKIERFVVPLTLSVGISVPSDPSPLSTGTTGGGDGEEFGHVVFDHFFGFFEEVGCGVTVRVGAIVRGGRAGVGGGVDFSGHVHTPHTHYFSNQRLQSSYLFVVSTVAFLI